MIIQRSFVNLLKFVKKMTTTFQFLNRKQLHSFCQDFYFTSYLHSKVKIMVDKKWLIQKELDSNLFSCTEFVNNSSYKMEFNKYPQYFIKNVVWKKLNHQPFVEFQY